MQSFIDNQFVELKAIIDQQTEGSKIIYADSTLLNPINFHKAELFKNPGIYEIQNANVSKVDKNTTVYILSRNNDIPAIVNLMQQLAAKISTNKARLYICPFLYQQHLAAFEQAKVLNLFQDEMLELWAFATYDANVFSMNLPSTVYKNSLSTIHYSNLLISIANKIGTGKTVAARGGLAVNILNAFKRIKEEQRLDFAVGFDQVIILDRSVDPFSPLFQGNSYAEQLTVHLGFQNNQIEKKWMTSTHDSIFDRYKHKNCNQVFETIADLKKELIQLRDEIVESQKVVQHASIMKKNMLLTIKLDRQQTEMERHVKFCTQLKNEKRDYKYLEYYFIQKEIVTGKYKFDYLYSAILSGTFNMEQELGLFLLYCQCCKPKQADVDKIKRLMVEQYGPKAELALINNQDLINNQKLFTEYNKAYNLICDDNIGKSECMNQSFGFYSPLSVKIVESIIKKEPKKDNLPSAEIKKDGEADKILVIMVGPLTHGEASALDVLRKQETNLDVICTDLCSGFDIMKLMSE